MKDYKIQNREVSYHFLKEDFKSAYKNNGKNIELALSQVASLRKLDVSFVRHILNKYIHGLKYKICPNCGMQWNGIECNHCSFETGFDPYWD